MPKIGAHVSAAVSLELSFQKARDIGAECTQIFISPPQQWAYPDRSPEEIERFQTARQQTGIEPIFIHGTYLINLGTSNPEHLQKSINWLIWALQMAEKLGVEGVIFHTGSHKGGGIESVQKQVVESIKKILNGAAGQTKLVLETSAGAGGSIGGTFHQLGGILKAVADPKLKVCLDTCHVFASGYDLRTPASLKDILTEFEEETGLGNLVAIHANDSKADLNLGKDRHENIGEGFIGREGFENLINHPKLKNIPFILEVPGFAGNGPDKENIDMLKSLRHSMNSSLLINSEKI